MCTDSPDTSGMNKAAEKQAELGEKSLEWYQNIYNESAPDRKAASAAALEQAGLQKELATESLAAQREERARYNTTFKPIEERIAREAMAYDTPARREDAARRATADTEIALSRASDSARREMERRGVNPASGRMAAMQPTLALAGAKAKAGAANAARDRVETVGAARLADAAGIGRGVFTNQTTQAQIGLNSGNSSVGNANVPNQVAAQGAQLGGAGFSTAMSGYRGAGDMYGKIAGIESGVDSANGQQTQQGVATVATIAIAI